MRTCDLVQTLQRHAWMRIGRSESDLDGPCTHYTLGAQRFRMRCLDVAALRETLAMEAQGAGPSNVPVNMVNFLFRPCFVRCTKDCFTPGTAGRMRVVFDVDPIGENVPITIPQPRELVDIFCVWLNRVAPLDDGAQWNEERFLVLGGQFADKPASYHVWFPDRSWVPRDTNAYKNNGVHFLSLNEQLARFGLKADSSITSGGLKVPFSDKHVKGDWRGDTMRLLLTSIPFLTYRQLFILADAVVSRDDEAWGLNCSFAPPLDVEPARGPAAEGAQAVRVQVGDGTALERVGRYFPAWDGIEVRMTNKADGAVLLVPRSSACPLKEHASDDAPAFAHAHPGKAYAMLLANDDIVIGCHICATRVTLASPSTDDAVLRRAFAEFNSRYALLSGDSVLVYEQRTADGVVVPARITERRKVAQQEAREDRVVKVDKKERQLIDLWFLSRVARRYELGAVTAPAGVTDPRLFNLWNGFDHDVVARSAEVPARLPSCWDQLLTQNICGGDDALRNFFLDWCAHMVQCPGEKPRIALVMIGAPGCGKGLVAQMLMAMIGATYSVQVGSEQLSGHWNAQLVDKVLIFADEVNRSNDAAAQDRLKMLITERQLTERQKYQPEKTVSTFMRVLCSSNRRDAVYTQPGERRFCVFDAFYRLFPQHSVEGNEFFARVAGEIESLDERASLLAYLQQRDYGDFLLRRPPTGIANWRVQYGSLETPERFVYHVLASGDLAGEDWAPDEKSMPLYEALANEPTNVQDNRHPATLVYGVFEKPERWFPKDMLSQVYASYSGNASKVPELYRYLFELVPKEHWTFKRARVGRDKRVNAFKFPPRQVLADAFLLTRGDGDPRIFTEWRIH